MDLDSELNNGLEFGGSMSAMVMWGIKWRRCFYALSPLVAAVVRNINGDGAFSVYKCSLCILLV